MSDRAAVLVALAAALGAAVLVPVPRWCALVAFVVVVAMRSPVVLAVAVALWASGSGAIALAALHAEARTGVFEGEVTLVGDPVPLTYGARVDVRVAGRRYEAVTDRDGARALAAHLAGERALVRATFAARPADAPWLDARHVAGRLRVTEVLGWRGAAPWWEAANSLRRTLERGARPLPSDLRALYTGLVYGDDRAQRALLADDFRAGGLGHLLAVSGQNVAFVLAAAGPVLRRVHYRARWPATLLVLVAFVAVTRAEPSVLRAAAMATIASRAATTGRLAPGLRVLALAVTVLVCLDPLLVRAVGFQMSVAASLGILVLGPRVTARLRGPAWFRELLGVTVAAQLAVAPVSVLVFGGVPLASIPANLLALPAAGPVMVWGLTGGLLAGLLGGPVATVLQLPTRLAVAWIAGVAARAGRAPLGTLRATHLAVLALAVPVVLLARTTGPLGPRATGVAVRRGAVAAMVVALVAPVAAARAPGAAAGALAPGAWLWRDHGVVVEVDTAARSADVLEALRDRDVTTIDLLVVRAPTAAAGSVARDLRTRYDPPLVWAPPRHQVRGATVPAVGDRLEVGGLAVEVLAVDERVRVGVRAV